MKTIISNVDSMIEIKNSKFITILLKINDSNIDIYLSKIKKEYPKATHYCYGYICGNEKKSSDDGEPGGTAGMPILNVLEKEQLNYVLAIVVRYFGGIKLGAGGLVRAYTKCVTETLKMAEYVDLIEGYKIRIEFPYSEEKQLNYLLRDSVIVNKYYKDLIIYIALITKDLLDKIKKYKYIILDELYIEKKN